MNNRIMIFVLLTIIFSMLAPSVAAQMNGDRIGMLRTEMERTDEIIRRAKEVVVSSQNPLASSKLSMAIQFQKSAWTDFHGQRFIMAADLTRS